MAHSLFDAVDEEEMSNEITLIAHDTLHHQSQFEKQNLHLVDVESRSRSPTVDIPDVGCDLENIPRMSGAICSTDPSQRCMAPGVGFLYQLHLQC